jgi:transcriptional antiterminator NusG
MGELKKVEWPTQNQLIQGVVVVLIACLDRRRLPLGRGPRLQAPRPGRAPLKHFMFRWYVINTYSGHENKVKANLEHRIMSMNQAPRFRRVVVPTEQVIETKEGQKVQTEKRVLPGYVLVNMDMTDEAWTVVKNTPASRDSSVRAPSPSRSPRVRSTASSIPAEATASARGAQVEYALGESVKVTSGPLSDFDGEVVDVNADQQKLKVLVDIFERQVPVELTFDQVKKLD